MVRGEIVPISDVSYGVFSKGDYVIARQRY